MARRERAGFRGAGPVSGASTTSELPSPADEGLFRAGLASARQAGRGSWALLRPRGALVSGRLFRYITRAVRRCAWVRRGGRVVECTALEMRHTGNRIGGSNPSLSAT